MVNGWKITAIIFIVLFILEAALIVWAYQLAIEDVKNESDCAYNICYSYDAYTYNSEWKLCQCYEGERSVKTEYIR